MKPPNVIYLQWYDEDGKESEDVTWCQDRIYDKDIVYIRQGDPPVVPDDED